MADAQTIIDIEVNDQSFKAFAESFTKFQKAVDDATAKMGKLGDKTEETAKKSDTSWDHVKKSFDELFKKHDSFNKLFKDTIKTAGSLATLAEDIAGSFGNAALSFAKFAVAGALTGFGLKKIADSAGQQRYESLQLGISTSQLESRKAVYDTILGAGGTEGALRDIAAAKLDPTKGVAFSALGIKDYQSKDAAQLLDEVAKTAGKFKDTMPQVLDALGITNIISQQQIQALGRTSPEEIQQRLTEAQATQASVGVDPEIAKKMQDFSNQLGIAAKIIEKSFTEALVSAAPALKDLAEGVASLSKALAPIIGLLAKILGMPFAAADWLDKNVLGMDEKRTSYIDRSLSKWHQFATGTSTVSPTAKSISSVGNSSQADYLTKLEQQYPNLPKGLLASVWGAESNYGRDPNTNIENSKGALGPFQFTSATAKDYGLKDRTDFKTSAESAAVYLNNLMTKFHGDVEKTIVAYNAGPGRIGNSSDWLRKTPQESQQYLKRVESNLPQFRMTINNETGGSAIASMASGWGQ